MNISRSLAVSGRERTILRPASMAYGKIKAFTTTRTTQWAPASSLASPGCGQLGSVRRCAVMCAEAVWWRCHRRIIADYLLITGERVFHILGPKAVTPRVHDGVHITP